MFYFWEPNYHHSGAPKLWYIVPGSEKQKLERLIAKLTQKRCSMYIRHKQIMVPPSLLKNKIKFARVRIFQSPFLLHASISESTLTNPFINRKCRTQGSTSSYFPELTTLASTWG